MNFFNYLRGMAPHTQHPTETRPWKAPTRVVLVWCTIIASSCLLLTSIVELATKAAVANIPGINDVLGIPVTLYDPVEKGVRAYTVDNSYTGPLLNRDSLVLANASLCFALAMLTLWIAIRASRVGPWQTTVWIRIGVRGAAIATMPLSIATVATLFIDHAASAWFQPELVICGNEDIDSCWAALAIYKQASTGNTTVFDRESWYCGEAAFLPPGYEGKSGHQASALCTLDAGSRWVALLLPVFAALLVVLLSVDWAAEQVLLRAPRQKGEVDCEEITSYSKLQMAVA